MLYDPKWEQKTETRPTIAGFVVWLETQNSDEIYDWLNCSGLCAVSKYLTHVAGDINKRNSTGVDRKPFEMLAIEHPRTYGELLKRARSALAGVG